MAVKKVYLNPGDLLEIRVINDPLEPKTASCFEHLKTLRLADNILINIDSSSLITFSTGLAPRVGIRNGKGDIVKYL